MKLWCTENHETKEPLHAVIALCLSVAKNPDVQEVNTGSSVDIIRDTT